VPIPELVLVLVLLLFVRGLSLRFPHPVPIELSALERKTVDHDDDATVKVEKRTQRRGVQSCIALRSRNSPPGAHATHNHVRRLVCLTQREVEKAKDGTDLPASAELGVLVAFVAMEHHFPKREEERAWLERARRSCFPLPSFLSRE
jgi:hypothetical protein